MPAQSLVNLADLDLGAIEVGEKERQPLGLALHLVQGGGAGKQHHLACHLGDRDPDLLPVDQVATVAPCRTSCQLRRVQAGIGLGHCEADAYLAAEHRRDHALPLLFGTEQDHRLHARTWGRGCWKRSSSRRPDSATACITIAASVMPKPAPPTASRHGHAEPASFGHRFVEVVRKDTFVVTFEPVLIGKLRAVFENRVSNSLLIFREGEIHDRDPCVCDGVRGTWGFPLGSALAPDEPVGWRQPTGSPERHLPFPRPYQTLPLSPMCGQAEDQDVRISHVARTLFRGWRELAPAGPWRAPAIRLAQFY